MRLRNSIKNIYISILTQIVMVFLGFISRRIFITNLGSEYLGVNGLLINILSMASLVEAGIGASITYSLYKPLAENDTIKIISLVQLYKKVYRVLAVVICMICLGIFPFLNVLITKSTDIPHLKLVYVIFVINNVIIYFNAHKWALINADQKAFVLGKNNLLFSILTTVGKIIIIKATSNYILFLLIELIITILQNIYNGRVVNNRYPYILSKEKYSVDIDTKYKIRKNVKALFMHKIGSYVVFGTDNILITAFVGLRSVGLYSNYTLIIDQLKGLLNPVLNGISESVGNLLVTEDDKKIERVFNQVYLVNFWIYSFSSIFLYNLLEPFIDSFFGKNLLLDKFTFLMILTNFYVTGMRESIYIFKTKGGIFNEDKFIPILEALVNLSVSIIMLKLIGLAGVFIGTIISTLLLPFWIQAKLVYNNILNKSVFEYLRKYVLYILIMIIAAIPTTFICNKIEMSNVLISLINKGIICIIIPNFIFVCALFKTSEFQDLYNLILGILKKVFNLSNSEVV